MKSILAVIILSLPVITTGQSSPPRGLNPAAESRVREILKSLGPDNALRPLLERGGRGDGIHHAWMDSMKRHGIRQVSFVIGFDWNDGIKGLKVRRVSYLREYYRYDSRVRGGGLLMQVRDSGLARELSDAALARARDTIPRLMENVRQTAGVRPRKAHGTLYLHLLDDEALPTVDEMPNVEW